MPDTPLLNSDYDTHHVAQALTAQAHPDGREDASCLVCRRHAERMVNALRAANRLEPPQNTWYYGVKPAEQPTAQQLPADDLDVLIATAAVEADEPELIHHPARSAAAVAVACLWQRSRMLPYATHHLDPDHAPHWIF